MSAAHRIIYFTDSHAYGGAEQSLLTLLGGLDRRLWHPLLVHHSDEGLSPLIEGARRLQVETLSVPRMPDGAEGAQRVLSFAQKIRALKPAVFDAHQTWPLACKFGLLGALLARIPAVIATTHLFVDLPYTRSERFQQRLLAARVHRYIVVSQELRRRLRQTFGFPLNKIQVIYRGIDLRRFQQPGNPALRAEWTKGMERPVVLTIARLDQQKGHTYLLGAAAAVPEALFVLAGDGPERSSLEAQALALGLEKRVLFLGYRDDIPDLLANCDLFVLPSLFEGLSLSIMEAMAAGKPVIATAISGMAEIVTHYADGLLVPPADPAALAEAIRSLLSNSVLAGRLVAAAQARVQRQFAVSQMVCRSSESYCELLKHNGCRQHAA